MDQGVGQSQFRTELASTMDAAEEFCKDVLNRVRQAGFGDEEVFAIHLALEEALTNAVQHGNCSDPGRKVHVRGQITADLFEIVIRDEGPGFQPDTLPDPRSAENLYRASGRGVLLIRAYMDKVEYNVQGNQIHMIKYRDSSSKGC